MSTSNDPDTSVSALPAADFQIVVADDVSTSTRHAAEELGRFLGEILDATVPVVSDAQPLGKREIVVGDNAHLRALGIETDFRELAPEGYVLRTVGPHLAIAGGEPRGNLYGVYGFLEDHLGCRWFTPEVSRIPKCKRLEFGAIDETKIPALEYRAPAVMDGAGDPDWCARNRVNAQCRRWVDTPGAPPDKKFESRHAAPRWWGGRLGVHTFFRLAPPEKHFDEHPEYYSLINGKRRWKGGQLCCTNDDLVRVVTEEALRRIASDPEARYFSVSQEDHWGQCQCESCQALAKEQGTQAAPVLYLVNRVAEEVEKHYPDKVITTLAYQWTRKPPTTMRPRNNVMIRLCSIECDFGLGVSKSDHPSTARFREDIEGWSRVSERLFIWNYTTNFSNYYMPHPTLRALNDDIKFFVEHNARGIYEQDTQLTPNADMSPLGVYMMAKFLWDPDYDEDKAIDEFLEGVYRTAAGPIRRYVDLLHDKIERDHIYVHCYGGTRPKFLPREILAECKKLWDEAEAAVADEPETLERVQFARLSYEYAQLELDRSESGQPFRIDHENFIVEADPRFAKRCERFFSLAERAGVMTMREGPAPLSAYREKVLGGLFPDDKPLELTLHKAIARDRLEQGLKYEYFKSKLAVLPDFAKLEPDGRGLASNFDVNEIDRPKTYFAMRFEGFIRVPTTGVYTFWTYSDDGSQLFIGDELVVDNDGGGTKKRKSCAALEAGTHPITVTYYMGQTGNLLKVTYAGPNMQAKEMPANVLFRCK